MIPLLRSGTAYLRHSVHMCAVPGPKATRRPSQHSETFKQTYIMPSRHVETRHTNQHPFVTVAIYTNHGCNQYTPNALMWKHNWCANGLFLVVYMNSRGKHPSTIAAHVLLVDLKENP